MRKLIIVFLIVLIAKDVSSQGDHFIYIQADNQKPFYVRSGTKFYRSSGEGYLVIPGLSANNYELVVGFSGNGSSSAEWRFDCTLGEKDLGFTLKNNGSSPPQLIGLRQKTGLTGTKVPPKEEKKPASKPVELTGVVSDDPFSKMLADVVNDPTIRQQPVIIEKKTEPVLVASGVDSTSVAKTNAIKKDSVSQPGSLTAVIDNKPVASTPVKENKPFVVKETPLKTDSAQTKAIATAKTDSAAVVNTVADKPQSNQPFVVKEIKKETPPATSPKMDSSAAIAKANTTTKEPFVLKETIDTKAKPAEAKDSADKALTAKADAPKPIEQNKPKDEPFVVKELPAADNKAAVASNDASGKKTLPFTVQPQDTPSVAKEQPKTDNKTSKKDSAAMQPKEETFVVKELPKADNKTTPSAPDNATDKKTLPFTVEPKQEPVVVAKEVPKTDTKSQQTSPADLPKATTTAPKEDKPFVLKETVAGKKDQPNKTAPAPAANTAGSSVSIKKTLQRKSNDGIELIYVDEGLNGAKDTIRILIPVEK